MPQHLPKGICYLEGTGLRCGSHWVPHVPGSQLQPGLTDSVRYPTPRWEGTELRPILSATWAHTFNDWLLMPQQLTHRPPFPEWSTHSHKHFLLWVHLDQILSWSYSHSLAIHTKSVAGSSRPSHHVCSPCTLLGISSEASSGTLYNSKISRSNTGVSKSNISTFHHLGWAFSWYFG